MFTVRRAELADVAAIAGLMQAAIGTLQAGYLTAAQIEASRLVMGLDTTLIEDGTYFVALLDGAIVGCGGWSRRTTLFGGDHSAGRDAALLVPGRDPARIRAMYTAPAQARRGIGRLILRVCEDAAVASGFGEAELAATLAGVPLYAACGYVAAEPITADAGRVSVPLVRMRKRLVSGDAPA